MKHVGLISALLPMAVALAADGTAANKAMPAPRPNIVVLLADDMHWNLPGFNGGHAATPNLDRLAREGTRFRQFYVHAVCSPTRAALLTGRY
ncbi:MAG: sulfatase-like hydrolase/transferase, partial [Planctomycetota bacterium]